MYVQSYVQYRLARPLHVGSALVLAPRTCTAGAFAHVVYHYGLPQLAHVRALTRARALMFACSMRNLNLNN